MPSDEVSEAWPRGIDPGTLLARARTAHERFVTTGALPIAVRHAVAASWRRSLRSGVDPEQPAPRVDVGQADLRAYRREHPLWGSLPVVRSLLLDDAVAEGFVVALTDEHGRLMWIGGHGGVRRSIEGVGFVEGADWREELAGTNAPGTALHTGHDIQVLGTEHFARAVHPWSCTAVVLRDPVSGRVLGALDVTGRDAVASPLMLSLVRATAAAVTLDLRARTVPVRTAPGPPAVPSGGDEQGVPSSSVRAGSTPAASLRLDVLRPDSGALVGGDGQARHLVLRHAELLLLLAEHPRGLHADELGVLLHPDAMSDVTVRAEMSRLRRAVGDVVGQSRPYRLTVPLVTDVSVVRDRLRAGDVRGALLAYPGPVLPRSRAPGVEQVRDALMAELRAEVVSSSDPVVLESWLDREEGADDWQAWERLVAVTAPGSASHTRARGRLELLVRRIGLGPTRHPWR